VLLKVIASIFLFSFVSPASATTIDAETRVVLKAIADKYKKLGNWTGTFTQETKSVGLGNSTFNEGQLHFVTPNRFRYSLVRPEVSDFISNGKSAWHVRYAEGREKPANVLVIQDLRKTELDRYLVFLRGAKASTPAEEKALLEAYTPKGKSSADELVLELTPKRSAEIAKVSLIFKQKSEAPYRVIVEDVLGTRTSVTVNSFERIKKTDPKLFEPKIPAGSKTETLK